MNTNLIMRESVKNVNMLPSNSYYRIWGFMISDLNLNNAELLVYAVIYNYFKNGDSFSGSRKYLAQWTGYGLTMIDTALKKLISKGLIAKSVTYIRGIMVPEYTIVPESLPPIDMHKSILGMCRSDGRSSHAN